MTNNIPQLTTKIAIAISFDKQVDALVNSAINLFANERVLVTLVHVISPEAERSMLALINKKDPQSLEMLQLELRHVAENRLAMLASTFPQDLEIKTKVLIGDVCSSLISMSTQDKMDMVLLGTTKLKGLQTAQNLIQKQAIAVMIIHEDSHLMPAPSHHRMIAADDLGKGGESAVLWSYKLAELIGSASILHSHVTHPANSIRNFKKGELLLKQRFAKIVGADPDFLDDCVYQCQFSIGIPLQELERSAAAFRAAISVFSIHQIYHSESMIEGHVPFSSMINNNRLCLIVPPCK